MAQKKVLAFGASGLVGSKFLELNNQKYQIDAPDVKELDILDVDALEQYLKKSSPDAVINFAAFTDVQGAEKDKDNKDGLCYKINVVGAGNVAKLCSKIGVHLIHISTDYVFDGEKGESPYTEDDRPNPINWYGQTKYLAEVAVKDAGGDVAIARLCMPYSAKYELKNDVARFFLGRFQNGEEITAINDQKITPTIVDDIANALRTLIDSRSKGTYHVTASNWTTPFDFVIEIGKAFGYDNSKIMKTSLDEYNQSKLAKLLRYSWLSPAKFEKEFSEGILHTVEESVQIFKKQVDSDSIGVDSISVDKV